MSVQLSYSIDPAIAREGNFSTLDPGRLVVSKLAKVATPVGRLIVTDLTDLRKAIVPAAGVDITTKARIVGVSVMDVSLEATSPTATPLYGIGKAMTILRRGRIWVLAEDAVTAPGPVFVRFQNGTGDNPIGRFAFANSVDHDLLANAQFMGITGGADELVEIEVAFHG